MNAKNYIMVWALGLIAGVVLMERWRREGVRSLNPFAETLDESEATTPFAVTTPAPADAPTKVPALVVAGAKADVERVQRLLRRVTSDDSAAGPLISRVRRRATPMGDDSIAPSV